jgi:hypothetical protein
VVSLAQEVYLRRAISGSSRVENATAPARNPHPTASATKKRRGGVEMEACLWKSKMQVKHTKKKKDIGIHKSPPINTKITEDRKLSQINRKRTRKRKQMTHPIIDGWTHQMLTQKLLRLVTDTRQ